MSTRTKTRWTTDSRGRYSRRIGWKTNAKGKRVQHCFYLSTDLKKAKQRENWLVELWDHIEAVTRHNVRVRNIPPRFASGHDGMSQSRGNVSVGK